MALSKGRKDIVTRELIESIQAYRDGILSKPEDDRTKREELIIEACVTLEELLRRHEAHTGNEASRHSVDASALTVLRSYNEVNREYDLRNTDLDLAATVRKGAKGHGSK